MKSSPLKLAIVPVSIACAVFASCSPTDEYDTPPPYRQNYQGYDTGGAYGGDSLYGNQAAYGDGSSPRRDPAPRPGGLAPGLPADPAAGGFVPSPPPAPSPATATGRPAAVHTVVSGDTLSGISRQYGVGMDAIRRANNMTGDIVVLGKKLIIPSQ